MSEVLRFDGRVALVTGAGGGLGRSHALLLAARGARVLVNDLGTSHTGEGQSSRAADAVVEEIRAAGGEAMANHDSVEDGARIVQAALDAFGRLDIVVNNAGILRDVSFHKMRDEDWELVQRVHLQGAYRVTRAAWPHLREQGYGRVLFTTSAAGLYGNFGQANYGAAKLGLVGLANSLAVEGAAKNIRVNTIAPIAASRMTETLLPPEALEALRPESVSPLLAWLAHESCPSNGGVFEVGGGFFSQVRLERTRGRTFKLGRPLTPELVRAAWDTIVDFSEATHPENVVEAMQPVLENLGTKSRGGNAFIDVDEALGAEYPPFQTRHDERDLALYALGVGAASDPLDPGELPLVYERHGAGFQPLPTYAVVPAVTGVLQQVAKGDQVRGLNYGLDRALHGEQVTELLRPLPPRATLLHRARVKDIQDKGKHALVVIEVLSSEVESGELLVRNEVGVVVRGAGGFGVERETTPELNVPPAREPDAVIEEQTHENQALLYRLSGDWNPLHADPDFARKVGYERPILHGLCTFGFMGRHVLRAFAGGDARRFKRLRARFADVVFPGETLRTEMWREGETIVLRCIAKERGRVVLSNASVELHPPEAPTPG